MWCDASSQGLEEELVAFALDEQNAACKGHLRTLTREKGRVDRHAVSLPSCCGIRLINDVVANENDVVVIGFVHKRRTMGRDESLHGVIFRELACKRALRRRMK